MSVRRNRQLNIRQTNRAARSGVQNRRKNTAVRAAVQKAGQRSLREGTHPQQFWRGGTTGARKKLVRPGARLGPMGELGDDVVFEIELQEQVMDLYILAGASKRIFSKRNMWRMVRNLVYTPVKMWEDNMIDFWVPSDTGDLRESLHNSITQSGGSQIQGFPFRVVLNTHGIPYAGPVNNMPTAWLRHPGSHGPTRNALNSGFLNDPNARKNWYNFLLLNGRKEAKKAVKVLISAVANELPIGFQLPFTKRTRYNYARSLFKIKYK